MLETGAMIYLSEKNLLGLGALEGYYFLLTGIPEVWVFVII